MTVGPSGMNRYRLLSAVCAMMLIAAGCVTLFCWLSDSLFLAGMAAGWIPMAPSTALFFIIYGTVILLHLLSRRTSPLPMLELCTISTCGILSLLLLITSLRGVFYNFEHFGLVIIDKVGEAPLGHMSPATAAGFALASVAFLLQGQSTAHGNRQRYGQFAALALIAANAVFLMAYLFGTPLFYGGPFVPPAVTTVTTFLALGAAIYSLSPIKLGSEFENSGTEKRDFRIMAAILLFLSLGITVSGLIYFRNFEQNYRLEAEKRLEAIADLKVNDISLWRNERLGDANALFNNPALAALSERLLSPYGDTRTESLLRGWLERVQASYRYEKVWLLDRQMKIRISVPETGTEQDPFILDSVAKAMDSGKVTFLDFHRHGGSGPLHFSVVIPIIKGGGNRRLMGAVLLWINPEQYLYPFIRQWPIPSGSGETLLVRREGNDVVFLNQLRFSTREPLSIRIPLSRSNLPAARAVQGEEGIVEGNDYRGVPVVASLRRVPGSPWFLVAKVDRSDIYAPLRERLWLVTAMATIFILGSAAGVWLLWQRRHQAHLKNQLMVESEKATLFNLLERSLNKIYIFEPQSLRITFANRAAWENTGYQEEELKGLNIADIEPELSRENFQAIARPLLSGEMKRLVLETVHKRKDGSTYPAEVYLQLMDTEKGQVFLSIVNDISARKQAEDALKESEERYRGLIECAPIAIFINRNSVIEYANPSALRLFGAASSDIIMGRSPYDFVHPSFHGKMRERIATLLKGGSVPLAETSVIALDGVERQVEVVASSFSTQSGPAILVMMNDISERKAAEKALRVREDQLRLFIEYAPAPLAMFDREMRYLFASRRWLSDYRLGELDLRGISHYEVFPEISPEWREVHRRCLSGEVVCADSDMFQRGDGSVQWLRWEVRPWLEDNGDIGGIIIFSEDISERKLHEEELEKKNLELEQLNYTVSHDLKSPLVTIKTFLGYLDMDMKKGDQARVEQDMSYMRIAAERMGILLEDLFNLTRVGRVHTPPIDIPFKDIASEAVSLVAGRISQRGVATKICESPLVLHGDRFRLVQLWQNLVDNSVKFMGEQQVPSVEIGIKENKAGIIFYVRDNGKGIDPRHREKVFGLFEQLEPGVEGTGIGLALVKRIVDLYEGKLWVESEGPGKGAEFLFTLPGAVKKLQ